MGRDVMPQQTFGSENVVDTVLTCEVTINVVILSDMCFMQEALVEKLIHTPKLKIIDVASTLYLLIERSLPLHPDVILIDATFPGALDAVRCLQPLATGARIIALALADHEENIIAWAEAGMAGYIPRSTALAELVPVLESMLRGDQVCSPHIAGGILRRLREAKSIQVQPGALLTRRESEVVALVGEGLSNKEIARRLGIGLGTTKTHVHNILRKFGLKQRSQLALYSYTASRSNRPANAL